MDLKKLINQKVTHTRFGNGFIVNITKNNVSVKFKNGEVHFFSFPNTFKNNIIRFIDIDHDEVLKEIENPNLNKPEKETPTKQQKPEVVVKPIIKQEKEPIKEKPIIKQDKPEIVEKIIKKEAKTTIPVSKEPKKIEENLYSVVYEDSYNNLYDDKLDDYEKFLNEFKEYWNNKKLLSYIVVKYVNNKRVFKKLKEESKKIILKAIDSKTEDIDKGIVTVFISMIAHKEYDGTIWPYIEQELEELYLKEDQLSINNTIRKLIHDNEYGGEVSVLIHAGIFVKYYKDYYTFFYDIYKANFDQNLVNVPVIEILTDTFKGIKEDLIKENSDLLYLKITNSTYYLAKYTKQALIISPEEMAKVAIDFLRHIDLWYHENKYDKMEPNLHRALKIWLEIEAEKITKIIGNKNSYIIKPTFTFNPNSMEILLNFKTINLVGLTSIDYKKLDISIKDDTVVKTLNIDIDYRIYQRIGYYSIKIREYLVSNPFANISLKVTYDKKTIYKTDETLTKDIYVFNDVGTELTNTNDHLGFAYVVHNPTQKFLNAKEYPFGSHKISYLELTKAITIDVNNEPLDTFKDLKLGLNGQIESKIKGKVNKKDYDVYKELDSFVFENYLKAKDMILSINKTTKSLSEMVKEDNKANELFRFIIDFKKINLVSDTYNIEIKDLKNNLIESFDFIYDKNLTLNIKEKDDLLVDSFLTSAFPIKEKEKINYNLQTENDLKYVFKLNNKIVEYVVSLNKPRFKYSQNSFWQTLTDVELISDELYVTNDIKRVDVYSSSNLTTLKEKNKNGGFTVYDLKELKNLNLKLKEEIKIVFHLENGDKPQYKLYQTPTVVGTPKIKFYNKNDLIVDFDIKCFQKDKWILEITDPQKGKKRLDLTTNKAIIRNLIPFKRYTFTIKDKQNISYGRVMSDFYEESFIFVDAKALEGKTFSLRNSTYLNSNNKKENFELNNMTILFKRIITNKEEIKRTTFNNENVYYEIEFYNIAFNNSLRPFKYNKTIYAEVQSQRTEEVVKLKIEDIDGNKIGADVKKNRLINKYKKKNTPLLYLYINILNDLFK